ncbi:MAG: D-arabinono-1,4-lactone oxidase [Actinomycetota bacterium]|nr:D-arabinono-1,4-lactone oxidase [Actinomycetota bacterium]
MTPDTPTWRNWGGTQSATPTRVVHPTDVLQIVDLVRDTAGRGGVLKPVGAGHSFSAIAVADDVQVDLSAMRGLVRVDGTAVTVRAGTYLHEMPAILAPYGLAMPNLGDVDRQSIAGATATGTHGTGLRFGGVSTQISAVTLVSGTGDIVTVGPDDPDLAAAALGLGALGVLVEITLACVPEFGLRAVEAPATFDDALDGFVDRVSETDHHEFFWFPHTACALTKSNTRIGADTHRSGPGRVRRYVDDELLSNKLFGMLCAVGARVPAVVPAVAQLSGRALGARTYTDRSDEVFVSSRGVRFREMEYAVALHEVPDVLREVRTMIDRRRYRVSFPVEVRAAAADDLMLSTAAGRPTGYIAVHRYHGDDPADADAYFADVERIMSAHGGRPHWGKMHGLDADTLRRRYPRFDEFLEVRNRFDPARVFANRYLRRVLGD